MRLFKLLVVILVALITAIVLIPINILLMIFYCINKVIVYIASFFAKDYVQWTEVIQYDRFLGWKNKPNLKVNCLAEDIFQLTTDEDGWRGTLGIHEADMVIFGDSFSFGYGVGDKYYFANLTKNRAVKALGSPGYNMIQEYMLMESLRPLLDGKIILWFIYIGNDLYENLQPNMMSYRSPYLRMERTTAEWLIETSHLSPKEWPYNVEAHIEDTQYRMVADICADSYFSRRAYLACEELILRGKILCESMGAELKIISIPDALQLSAEGINILKSHASHPKRFDVNLPDNNLSNICQKLKLNFIPLKKYLKTKHYNKIDKHWNASGNKIVAKILDDLSR